VRMSPAENYCSVAAPTLRVVAIIAPNNIPTIILEANRIFIPHLFALRFNGGVAIRRTTIRFKRHPRPVPSRASFSGRSDAAIAAWGV
jgi:hypothetical protein